MYQDRLELLDLAPPGCTESPVMPMILSRHHGIRATETASFEVLVSPPSPSLAGWVVGCCSHLSKIPYRTGAQVEAFIDRSSATAFSA
jgi:hypothetical protein